MDFYFIRFMLTLVVTGQVSSLPLACSYNGTAYADGEIIVTEEPCLSCVCRSGSLVCNLRVCADSPDTLGPGCFLVHKANDCCPQLLCEETYRNENVVELRTGFKTENTIVENGCFINGSIYAEGSAVASSQLCEYCYCVQGEMKCIKPRCFQPFEGCKALYREPSCCPTHYDCRDMSVSITTIKDDYGCESEGIYYHDGEMVKSSNSSKCENCYCMKGKIMCAPITCSMNVFEDCEPVNSPGQCCPTSFACKKPSSMLSNSSITTLYPEIDKNTETTELFTEAEETTTESESDKEGEARTEESTTTAETEIATNSKVKEYMGATETDTGFQATGSVNGSNEVTTVLMDKTSTETPTTPSTDSLIYMSATASHEGFPNIDIPTEINFGDLRRVSGSHTALDEIVRNSSQNSDDYDVYDYSEPILPPSLPNLVIFPFVAADAVVKEESTPKPEIHQESIKRIDTQAVYYKDYFSPPVQTEGGFVPKEPTLFHKHFYQSSYSDKKNHSPGLINQGGANTVAHITIPPRLQNEAISPQLMESPLIGIAAQGIPIVTPDPFGDVFRTDSTPDIHSIGDLNPFHGSHQTTKPVTVTYKNIVVDYYPDYLITTTRNNFKEKPSESLAQNGNIRKHIYVSASAESDKRYSSVVVGTTQEPQHLFKKNQSEHERVPFPVFAINPVETTTTRLKVPSKKTTGILTTSESSFFNEFLKSFLSEDPKPVVKTSPKYKYSSKIKGPATTTSKPIVEDVTDSAKLDYNSSTSSYSFFDFLFDSESSETDSPIIQRVNKTKDYTTGKPAQEETEKPTKTVLLSSATTQESRIENMEAFNSKLETEQLSKPLFSHREDIESEESKANLGGLLKLAGCNIYGRMYRVGKIIVELSGPCLECVCTDLGVQCKQLIC